ncbi:hypothetical protein WJX73_008650 [Symbiochloris irregularis]|uniref:Metal-dependent protein hydrolase n=1 Tax=Symbiochloris irregularis TaxID=706552 RepID=A0AAW1NNQ0_9CHLO
MASVGTHSGTFHCDEALGCYLLKRTSQFKDAKIVRSRDPAVLQPLDAVLDVGGVYQPEHKRFDHHQRGFNECFGHGFTTKLSSAGLIYKHYGREIVAAIMGLPIDHEDVSTVYLAAYRSFIEAVDAIDNGVDQYEGAGPRRYANNTHLSARVAGLNPRWNEDLSSQEIDSRFQQAMQLTGREFEDSVDYLAKAWLPGRAIVEQSIQQRHEVDPSGQIMCLRDYAPWKSHIYDLEESLNVEPLIKFVLYEDDREKAWRIQAVSVDAGSFQNRLSLPAAWQGLRDAELSEASGIPNCIFVHASGFIGGNRTYEGVLKMAQKALEQSDASGTPDAKRAKAAA